MRTINSVELWYEMDIIYVDMLFLTAKGQWTVDVHDYVFSQVHTFSPARISFRLKLNCQMPTGVWTVRRIPFQCLTVAENRIKKEILPDIGSLACFWISSCATLLPIFVYTNKINMCSLVPRVSWSNCLKIPRLCRVMRESTYSHHWITFFSFVPEFEALGA